VNETIVNKHMVNSFFLYRSIYLINYRIWSEFVFSKSVVSVETLQYNYLFALNERRMCSADAVACRTAEFVFSF